MSHVVLLQSKPIGSKRSLFPCFEMVQEVVDHVVNNIARDTSCHGPAVQPISQNALEEGDKDEEKKGLPKNWRKDKSQRVLRERVVDSV